MKYLWNSYSLVFFIFFLFSSEWFQQNTWIRPLSNWYSVFEHTGQYFFIITKPYLNPQSKVWANTAKHLKKNHYVGERTTRITSSKTCKSMIIYTGREKLVLDQKLTISRIIPSFWSKKPFENARKILNFSQEYTRDNKLHYLWRTALGIIISNDPLENLSNCRAIRSH